VTAMRAVLALAAFLLLVIAVLTVLRLFVW
jgi:hypothetical protein